jgi:hypothetical protein
MDGWMNECMNGWLLLAAAGCWLLLQIAMKIAKKCACAY